jgi:hypothetical protein
MSARRKSNRNRKGSRARSSRVSTESRSRSSSSEGEAGFTSAGDSRRYSGAERTESRSKCACGLRARPWRAPVGRARICPLLRAAECRWGQGLCWESGETADGRGWLPAQDRRRGTGRNGGERKEVHLRGGMKRGSSKLLVATSE